MKRMAVVFGLMMAPLLLQAENLEITVQRKKEGLGQAKGDVEKTATQNWTGEVKVVNHAFQPVPELEARYILFVKRQELGEKPNSDHVEKVKGKAKVNALKPGESASILTSEVELRQQKLAGGYYYVGGGSSKAEDTIAGVWIKLFNAGKEAGEYVNPPTLKA